MTIHQRKAFFLLVLAVVGVTVLAVGLPDMQLEPGLPIPGAAEGYSANPTESISSTGANRVPFGFLLQSTLALGMVVLLILLLIGLFRRADPKRLLQLGAGLAVVVVVLLLLPRVESGSAAPASEDLITESTSQYTFTTAPIGTPPLQLYGFVIGFLFLCALIVSAWLLREFIRKPKQAPSIATAVDAALRAINDGQNLQNVIIQCYLDMARALKTEKGMEREQSVTPREFENWLAVQGVPDAPIRQLTRLFEKARYGGQLPVRDDEQAAIECLSAILAYCEQGLERRG